jgi:hypothetical protein
MSLRRRIFAYWIEHHLDQGLDEEEQQLISSEYNMRKDVIDKSKFYKDSKVNANPTDFSSTKLPSDLAAMSIKT